MSRPIRQLEASDHEAAIAIYREAVLTSTSGIYSAQQQTAWASQSEGIRRLLQQGRGLVHSNQQGIVQAFSLRFPPERLALLYCHPQAQRQGLGRQLIQASEAAALAEGVHQLRTEASLISQPLFANEGWQVSWCEELRIAGVPFRRYRMHKQLGG
jgi:putative acetyltransferase